MLDHSPGVPAADGRLACALVGEWAALLPTLGVTADDAERVSLLTALEDLKDAAAAAQARIAVDFAASQEREQADAGVPAARRGAGIAAQVALARRESPHRGGRLLGLAKALVREMPRTFQAMESGSINEWRATLIVRETACLTRENRTGIDDELWADPAAVTALGDRALVAKVKALAYRSDPQSVVNRAARAECERTVTLRPAPDTMAYLTALVPVAQGVAAYAALSRAADAARADGDPRTRGQVLADTLVERATGLQHAADVAVQVNLVITDESLLDGGVTAATLTGYGPLPSAVGRRLAGAASKRGRASLRRLYTRPDDGRLVALESRARHFPKGLGEFLELRDQTCRTPWCDAPIRHLDHIVSAVAEGPTSAGNGQGLCEACNYAKQAPGWRARPSPDGAGVTTTPTGALYTSPEPDPPWRRRPPRAAPRPDVIWSPLLTDDGAA